MLGFSPFSIPVLNISGVIEPYLAIRVSEKISLELKDLDVAHHGEVVAKLDNLPKAVVSRSLFLKIEFDLFIEILERNLSLGSL